MNEDLYNKISTIQQIDIGNPFDQETEFEKWNAFDEKKAEMGLAAQELKNMLV